jgi:hypothetical protein
MEELCKQLEWSLLNAASSFSSFAGLAASLILASMVIIVVQYEGVENPTATVALFTVALLALGMDTFIFGAASGEVLCARGGAQGLLGGSTMATGVAILLLGVTLLQAKFNDSHGMLTLLGNVVTSLGSAGTMALLALWAVRLVNNLTILRLRPEPMISYAPSLILVGIFLTTIVVIALAGPSDRVRQTAIIVTTCIYLLHIFITFVMYVVTIVIPAAQWTVHTDSLVLTLTITIAIVFPLVELTCVVMALDWRTPPLGLDSGGVDCADVAGKGQT